MVKTELVINSRKSVSVLIRRERYGVWNIIIYVKCTRVFTDSIYMYVYVLHTRGRTQGISVNLLHYEVPKY